MGHFSCLPPGCLFFFAHPLSAALTMNCLSLQALALDRQVMEAVCPNNMALGQIWERDKKRSEKYNNKLPGKYN